MNLHVPRETCATPKVSFSSNLVSEVRGVLKQSDLVGLRRQAIVSAGSEKLCSDWSHLFNCPSADQPRIPTLTFTRHYTQNNPSDLCRGDIHFERESLPGIHRSLSRLRAKDSIAYNHQHNSQCHTQHSPRRAYRPSSSVVLESRSIPSHLRLRTCLKHSSPSQTVLWSGTLWTGVIAWVSLVCPTLRIRDNPSQIPN